MRSMRLEARGVWVKLGNVVVLRGVNVHVDEGECVALIGRNGAGKTTLVRTLIGVLRPFKGEVNLYVDKTMYRLDRLTPYKVARLGIGYAPQGRMVFPDLTVMENLEVSYGGAVPEDTLEWIYNIMPELKRLGNRKGRYLSGGEQQMLAIARALVRKPKILILDEPLEGLAPKITSSIIEALKEISRSGVAILITESGNVGRIKGMASRVYGIDRGEIIYSGDPDGILKDEVARARIWGV